MSFKQDAIKELDRMMTELNADPAQVRAGMLFGMFAFFLLLNTPANPHWLLLVLGWYGMLSFGLGTVFLTMLVDHRKNKGVK
ncbi:hypothetical protein [Hydrogenophaga sp. NFH-34]|uniref:hypothetical protein n=1 Tax=Hydrogenophaga sp. NFH-34 TaxID=2744446 RepID=UPI001F32B408|nr:hypothetical protein [Hydrogenophaga sp. NFH-34]